MIKFFPKPKAPITRHRCKSKTPKKMTQTQEVSDNSCKYLQINYIISEKSHMCSILHRYCTSAREMHFYRLSCHPVPISVRFFRFQLSIFNKSFHSLYHARKFPTPQHTSASNLKIEAAKVEFHSELLKSLPYFYFGWTFSLSLKEEN